LQYNPLLEVINASLN